MIATTLLIFIGANIGCSIITKNWPAALGWTAAALCEIRGR